MCTALVNTLKDQFGGLREEVSLVRQDLQKIREKTTAVESRVSDIKDKLPPLAREAWAAKQLAQETNNRAYDMENHVRRNNICIVGLKEKTEGRDHTTFVENSQLDLFTKEAFSPFFTVEPAHCT